MTYKDKNDKSIILQCNAYDFEGIQFSIEKFSDDDWTLDIITLRSDFYNKQETWWEKIWKHIKLAYYILIGKEYNLFEICLDKDDMLEFKKFINKNINNTNNSYNCTQCGDYEYCASDKENCTGFIETKH